MENDEEILQSLIAGGLIGAALGALISKNKDEGATLGALAGAAILTTFRANEKAMQTNVPMYVEKMATCTKYNTEALKHLSVKFKSHR